MHVRHFEILNRRQNHILVEGVQTPDLLVTKNVMMQHNQIVLTKILCAKQYANDCTFTIHPKRPVVFVVIELTFAAPLAQKLHIITLESLRQDVKYVTQSNLQQPFVDTCRIIKPTLCTHDLFTNSEVLHASFTTHTQTDLLINPCHIQKPISTSHRVTVVHKMGRNQLFSPPLAFRSNPEKRTGMQLVSCIREWEPIRLTGDILRP